MSSLDMPVTLVVKAPNQQIEDQTIECELSWTIKRLKGYLSEVYPSKPRTEEQKLIYSGHLLHDACTLREVLRTYEGQQQHTVHLVCARQAMSTPSTSETSSDAAGSSDGLRRRNTPGASGINNPSTATASTNGTRAASSTSSSSSSTSSNTSRGVASSAPTLVTSSTSTPTGTPSGNPTANTTTPVTATPTLTTDPCPNWAAYYPGTQFPAYAQFPQMSSYAGTPQMAQLTQAQYAYAAWMQQAYAQYMAQYMHLMMAQASGSPMQWPLAASVTTNTPPATAANNEQPPAAQGQAGNAPDRAGPDDEDDEIGGQRDWLDWFYIMSRCAVLFSVVYFYSSPMRFIVVCALGLLMYLYQIGFFRPDEVLENNNDPARADAAVINNNNNINNDDNNNEPAVGVVGAAAAGADARVQPEDGEENEPAANTAGGAVVNQAAAQLNAGEIPDRPSLLALSWTFFTSFFASLIPEQPNVI